ncbi:ejaculatory bulb-specific protein 3-like precursor [Stomoxys calcitrans]|uniref:Putative chemosensory binding protein n=1 Tax=Stomoxys calcitrans TaxID=35570 RepID=D7R4I0_STOCA|nr:ejaculatory bulb-specific protein 3-like precursor [Stomoxys calcitrans]ADG96053.1 putative chemosensory binding protein [Stomoxys calcitrans]
MKFLTFVAIFAACLAMAIADDEKYTTKYDNVDLDEILKSDRLFKNYYNCLVDQGKCTPDGRELKTILPDALKTECSKCNEKQKEGADKVIRFMIENKAEEWKALQAKYDPEQVYYNKYKAEAEKRGIKV